MTIARADITGVVLAGGLGRRMGGVDKGFVELDGRPLVAYVVERLAPQVGTIIINANQNTERYARFGYPVVADAIGGFAGPLAGLHAGLAAAVTPYVVTCPCDSPFLPADLVARLAGAFEAAPIDIAVARTFAQAHPVFALVRRSVLPGLARFLEEGGRKIDRWYASLPMTEVAFDDEAHRFRNINTRDELLQSASIAR
ncbi:MAG: molybdenum cofactor guanylyltransferase MobA [Rudaea sp.]